MPEVAQIYLGNIHQNKALTEQIAEAKASKQLLEVHLQQSDRAKGRISCKSTSGKAIGIIKSRDLKIHTGDVYQTNQNNLLLVQLLAEEVLILSLPKETKDSAGQLVQLGHLLGNQHYPIQIKNQKVYVQLNSNQNHQTDLKNTIVKMIKDIGIDDLNISTEQIHQPLETIQQTHLHKHSH